MTDHSQRAVTLASNLQAQLADWVGRLPNSHAEARKWMLKVAAAPQELTQAMGIPTRTREQRAIQTVISSDHALFRQFRADLSQRLQIYLGGVEGLARTQGASPTLRAQTKKIQDIRRMLKFDPRSTRTPDRTLAAVTLAVNSGSLRAYRTGDVDSDLWVVLKTLQEHLPTERERLFGLVKFVADVVKAETAQPGQHISDRRHAWWAVRILYEASSITYGYLDQKDLDRFITLLLGEPLYNSTASAQWLSPEFNEQLTILWELTNISELLRGESRARLSDVVLRPLVEREESLMADVLGYPRPQDMRVATVSARACLTYVSDGRRVAAAQSE